MPDSERANGVRSALLQELKLPAEVRTLGDVRVCVFRCVCVCICSDVCVCVCMSVPCSIERPSTKQPTHYNHTTKIQAITVAQTVPELAQRCRQVCVSLPSEKVGEKVR